jgi:hypothetical protein
MRRAIVVAIFSLVVAACVRKTHVAAVPSIDLPRIASNSYAIWTVKKDTYAVWTLTPRDLNAAKDALKCGICTTQPTGMMWFITVKVPHKE